MCIRDSTDTVVAPTGEEVAPIQVEISTTKAQNHFYEPPNPTPLGNTVKQFVINTRDKFNHFRLFCFQAEGPNPGLSYMQLFIYSD